MEAVQKVTRWQQKLLDLGKRNRLLFFKPTRRTTLRLVGQTHTEIFQRLVQHGLPYEFALRTPNQDPYQFNEAEPGAALSATTQPELRPEPHQLLTDQPDDQMVRSLYQLRARARTAIEEQGTNILFVALGFLEWREAEASQEVVRSPLVLVPVELEVDSILDPYRLVPLDDDIVLNPTLAHKLQMDFGIQLPAIPDEEDWHLDDLLGEVQQLVARQGWRVVGDACLSLFSFLKLNMYKDLERHAEAMAAHPVIAAMAGDASRLPPLPDDLVSGEELDRKVCPHETFQVVDADSSQQEAILAAKRGVSFVLQGPPGTGKSQTITNIIAECLAAGKRVLFVSAKMAALEVVHKRLCENGLGDFSLQLHSHSANKKEVITELGRTLMLARTQITERAEVPLDQLLEQRAALNQVIGALHTERLPLGRTIYQVHGEVARLESAPDLSFPLAQAGNKTPADLRRYHELIAQLAGTAGQVGADYFANPWRGCVAPAFTLELQHNIATHSGRLRALVPQLTGVFGPIAAELGLAPPGTLAELAGLAELLALAGDSPQPPADWLTTQWPAPLVQSANRHQECLARYQAGRSSLLQSYQPTLFALAPGPLIQCLEVGGRAVLARLHPAYAGTAEELLARREELTAFLNQLIAAAAQLQTAGAALAGALGLEPPRTVAALRRLSAVGEWVARDLRPVAAWFDLHQQRVICSQVQEAREVFTGLQAEEQALWQRYDQEVLGLDVSGMLQQFRTEYGGFFRFLKSGFRRDMKALRAVARAGQVLDYPRALADLQAMKSVLDRRAWISAHEEEFARVCGSWYMGAHTHWDELLAALAAVGEINRLYQPDAVPEPVCALAMRSGAAVRQVAACSQAAAAALNTAESLLTAVPRRLQFGAGSLPAHEMAIDTWRAWAVQTLEGLTGCHRVYDKVKAHRTGGSPAPTVAETVHDLQVLAAVQAVEAEVNAEARQLQATFGHFFQGIETRWDAVLNALDWTEQVRRHFAPGLPPEPFVRAVCADADAIARAGTAAVQGGQLLAEAGRHVQFMAGLFEPHSLHLNRLPLAELTAWLTVRLESMAALRDWVDFRNSRARCAEAGLGPFVDAVLEQRIPPAQILPAFHKRFYRLWLDETYAQVPELQHFRGDRHAERIGAFRQLDRQQFRLAQARLRARLSEARPNPHAMTARGSEVAILTREAEKRRRQMPLRRLFQAIPNLLLTLKPCLLMSPLSVSQFLDPGHYQFDLVVFDEASQICSEDAIGAIYRSRQVIVVGDREQLPPTNFFGVSVGDGAFDDEEDDTGAYESVLDECSSVLHRKSLQWHYRSRHEHLIAFSNTKIYLGNLVTFPSPAERVPDQGVEFVHVPGGVYDRSGTRCNQVEALRVAELVLDHFRRFPGRSLGVVTFSEAQQSAVDAAIRSLRRQHAELEPFFDEKCDEPFFVKNLENVQGDERDTIIFSIGYARDQTGVVHMNFGPLSRQGGHRRLNVAITRAKYNVKLVSSMAPTDIDPERTGADGVRLLRQYMEFALHGPVALQRELRVGGTPCFDSPFEEAVYLELRRLGHHVDTQVGCSGYRIDLAVRHPDYSGHYLLGIECDGRAYHSAKTARDRDRLREDVLVGLGWRIHRIWSTDWIKDPRAEVARLEAAIAQARQSPGAWEAAPDTQTPVIALAGGEPAPEPLEMEVPPAAELQQAAALAGVVSYREALLSDISRTPGQSDAEFAGAVVAHVIAVEGPIHQDLLARRVAPLWGRERASSQVRREVELAVRHEACDRFVQRGDFFWPVQMTEPSVRTPGHGEKPRTMAQICVEERAGALALVLAQAVGMPEEDLMVEAARVLGFNRTGAQIRVALAEALAYLVQAGRMEAVEGNVRLVRHPSAP